jgi:hypothetical protein
MKSFIKILFAGLPILLSSSCKKYLDVVPDNVATLNSAFTNANETQAYLFGCYGNLQALYDIRGNAGFTTSGEIIFPINLSDRGTLGGAGGDDGFQILQGLQNADNPLLNFWGGSNLGLDLWQSIRLCNTFLDNVNTPPDLPLYEKTRWIAEAKFLKAYYHYWLIRMYGPIPIADKELPVNASTAEVRVKQQTVDSCFNYVVHLLDTAIAGLPPLIQNTAAEQGRITSTIALAVKAEVLATQASPLFNSNPDYAGMKGKDGQPFFSAASDPGKWQKALDACKAAIAAVNASGASLYQFQLTGNVVHMSDSTQRLLAIQGAVTESWNPEQIWTLNPQFDRQYMAAPRVTADAAANIGAVYSNFSVPIAESELFYTNKGVPINEDKTWDFAGRYKLQAGDSAHFYYIKQGYTCAKGNFNRENRYYADVSFDGSTWFGGGNTDDTHPNFVNAVNGFAASPDALRVNVTGYWPKKLVPYQTYFGAQTVYHYFSWPFMRLPALWLLYAECLNEVSGPGAEVYQYIDQVRARAGLSGVQNSWSLYSNNPTKPSTKDGLRQIIHQERRIELAFEGQAGWDLRRWKELQNVLTGPIQGWNIDPSRNNHTIAGYYQLVNYYQPVFGLRNYLYPISSYDLLINPNLVQSLYW